jgi:hypothetical protein
MGTTKTFPGDSEEFALCPAGPDSKPDLHNTSRGQLHRVSEIQHTTRPQFEGRRSSARFAQLRNVLPNRSRVCQINQSVRNGSAVAVRRRVPHLGVHDAPATPSIGSRRFVPLVRLRCGRRQRRHGTGGRLGGDR